MTAVPNSPPAPAGQQGPPARAAASAVRARRVARGPPPIDYRDGFQPSWRRYDMTDGHAWRISPL
jgi:hypothetical protein